MTEHRIHSRSDTDDLLCGLAGWDEGGTYVRGLHVGDVAWFLRRPDDHVAGHLHGWWRGDRLVAAAIVEDAVARPRVAPDLIHEQTLAAEVADLLDALPGDQLWSEAAHGSRLRQVLAVRGWDLDPDPWVALFADRSAGRPAAEVHSAGADPVARVSVQRSGFAGSTFDLAAWERMAALPVYDADLDLVLRDSDGAAVAAATCWLAGGGTAIVEPFAVHPDHRRRGYGTTLARAVVAACVDRGASGVSVCTPADNSGAVSTYRAAGFRAVESLQDMVRPGR